MESHVLPFYAVCDESYSMLDHLGAVNAALRSFHHAACDDPFVAGLIRFSLIGFSARARVIVPLSDLAAAAPAICLASEVETNFGDAFSTVRATIERDVEALTESAYRVLRPCVLFVSDGQSTDPATWPADYAAVADREWPNRPDVLALAVGDADLAALARIGAVRTARGGESTGRELHEFVRDRAVSELLPVPGGPAVDSSWTGLTT
jgi:uncharacterized protein YegL